MNSWHERIRGHGLVSSRAPVAQLHAEGEELILMMWYPSAIWEQTTNPTMSVVSI